MEQLLSNGDTVHAVLTMPQPAGEYSYIQVVSISALLFLWSIIRYRASGGTYLLILTAALASSLMEGWAEYMAMNYHPEIGGHIVYRAFGMPVPVHAFLAYVIYFGASGYYLVRAIQRGKSLAAWWKVAAIFFVFVTAADFGALSSGIWTYYGNQPLVVFKFPMIYSFCNISEMFVFGTVVHLCLSRLVGVKRLLTILIAPIGMAMGWGGADLPVAAALHSDAGIVQITLAAFASIAASLTIVHFCIQYFVSMSGFQVIPVPAENFRSIANPLANVAGSQRPTASRVDTSQP